MIGPHRGGRALAASGVPGKPNEYYFGAVGGGIWKSVNAGQTWEPIFDNQPIASIGALAVAPSDPLTIYVGSGEADMRSDISFGDGVYKSTDGGVTWRNMGLRDSRAIGRILIDPADSNTVLVAALGHAFGPNAERGVYRSTDGGATWRKVLWKNDDTGAIDLCFDPGDSRVVYASLWQTRRPPWSVYAPSSGPGSGLYKSTDGGVTWNQITGNGFPSEGLGRIGIAVAPGEGGKRVYALVDAKDGGLYRSDDAGKNWRRVSSDHRIWQRGWYFGGVTVDPRTPSIVYVANTALYRSTDSGENFVAIKGAPGGDDYHFLWIAPDDPARMILASDQGTVISVDAGKTWSSWFNQPTAQFYHVITDNRFPYWVYGAQQDSGTAGISSRSDYGQITFRDWMPVGGEESGYIALDPSDPHFIFGGGPEGMTTRFDWTTGQRMFISPWPGNPATKHPRFTWTSPLIVSPQDPRVLYLGAQFVMRTSDGGMSWQAVSPDLTARPNPSGAGSKTEEDRGVVYTIAPSSARAHVIWVGTDNGLIQLTNDEGKNWTNVTPAGLADWSMVSLIEASPFDAATAYAAVDRHQVDDFHPYIYRTHDSGKTWTNTVNGLPELSYVHAVREDPARKGLLYAGTETGVFVSFDDGDHWQPLQLNLPNASIRDLVIHGDDLVVATHGRSFWILDDIAPLREWNEKISATGVYLYQPAHAIRLRRSENHDSPLPAETPVGANPPAGAILDYQLNSAPEGEVAIEIRTKDGQLVRRFSSDEKLWAPPEPPQVQDIWLPRPHPVSKTPGMHRFVWDLRYSQPLALHYDYSSTVPIGEGAVTEPQGPLALPGDYEVRLIVAGKTFTRTLTLQMDPRVHISHDDLSSQLELARKIDAALSQATQTYREIADARSQLHALRDQLAANPKAAAVSKAADAFDSAAEGIAGRAEEYPIPATGLMLINSTLASLANSVNGADSAPTTQTSAAWEETRKQLSEKISKWDSVKKQELAALNKQLQAFALHLTVPPASGKSPAN